MEVQSGWRWCSRCQGLVFSGMGDGVCFDGDPHDLSASGAYSVPHGATPLGAQEGWRWCSRCQGLVFSGLGSGICFDEAPHDLSASGTYSVPHGTTPPGAQEGWRWCRRCQGLVFGGGDGACSDGHPHDLRVSGDYSVPHEEMPADTPRPLLRLDVAEQGRIITVTGREFTPRGRVHVAYIWGTNVWTDQVVADQDGGIVHEHRDTVPAAGGCLVIGRDESTKQFNANRAQRLRPRLSNAPTLIDRGTNLEAADD
jgi:hypothetical protein